MTTSIDLAITHFSNLGPGYPAYVGGGRIEWHGYNREWIGVMVFNRNNVTAVMKALIDLCAANKWVVDFGDTETTDPRDVWYSYEYGVERVIALRKLPDHAMAPIYRQNYEAYITKS